MLQAQLKRHLAISNLHVEEEAMQNSL